MSRERTFRRTKIVATTGPSTDSPATIESLIRAGVNTFRLNCSHGTAKDRDRRVGMIRTAAHALSAPVGIFFDLQGPKIRIGGFKNGSVKLETGSLFALDSSVPLNAGDERQVGFTYPKLPSDVRRGYELMLDDGRIVLAVKGRSASRIDCQVSRGGVLGSNKGINLRGGGVSAPALTLKDRRDIRQAVELGVDYIALSFVSKMEEIGELKQLIAERSGSALVIAKIERAEAIQLDPLEKIIAAADAVMVARGDLGVEIGDAQLPAVQKRIIRSARSLNKVVITATQMMESMIDSPLPTRAEVFDVANAVFDGTDAVMLSAETAIGNYPIEVVQTMDRICLNAEKQRTTRISAHRVSESFEQIGESIAMASMYLANHLTGVRGIAALTETGSTPLYMSRISSGKPIFALTMNKRVFDRMSLYRGVYPILLEEHEIDDAAGSIRKQVVDALRERNFLFAGQRIIVTTGVTNTAGGTNTMEVIHAQ